MFKEECLLFVGLDWAEAHHDVCLMNEDGKVLARKRVEDTLEGAGQLHTLLAEYSTEPSQVIIGVETDQGLLIRSLIAAEFQVYAINPKAVDRYRDRHKMSRAKSDAADAKVLADLVRTDRHNHRPVAGDSTLAQALKVLVRSHQRLIWARQRQASQLRTMLREFYPGALLAFDDDLTGRDAIAVLGRAPTPAKGRALTTAQLVGILRRSGRRRNLEQKAEAVHTALQVPQLEVPGVLANAYGASVQAAVRVIAEYNIQVAALETELVAYFEAHPDAEIITSLPGLGNILGARVLTGFGDDPTRYADSKARKNYASSSPITKASGTYRLVKARFPRNTWLADAGHMWAFSTLNASPGARAFYDRYRARGHTHVQALRVVANRLFGILHGCLRHRTVYSEDIAWPRAMDQAA